MIYRFFLSLALLFSVVFSFLLRRPGPRAGHKDDTGAEREIRDETRVAASANLRAVCKNTRGLNFAGF